MAKLSCQGWPLASTQKALHKCLMGLSQLGFKQPSVAVNSTSKPVQATGKATFCSDIVWVVAWLLFAGCVLACGCQVVVRLSFACCVASVWLLLGCCLFVWLQVGCRSVVVRLLVCCWLGVV